jgi:hypothetical protein
MKIQSYGLRWITINVLILPCFQLKIFQGGQTYHLFDVKKKNQHHLLEFKVC